MVVKNWKIVLLATVSLCFLSHIASAQKDSSGQTDSLVRLVNAESIQLIEKNGRNYRKTIRPTFLHNGTYLICDTALWSVEQKLINCWGNVKLMQEETVLTSDKLDYLVEQDLAQFRGTLVQLQNKEYNTLRTHYLDYNTRDSMALFYKGAAMRDADGQIIESLEGSYYSADKLFEFRKDVNMFTDSIFVKTTKLFYRGNENKAEFPVYIDFWKDGNMLSAASGWYDRDAETFFFTGSVHALTEKQECWSDSLYFYRISNDVLMLGNAQVQDTTRNITSIGGYIYYCDSLSRLVLQRDAAVAMRTEQENKVDTLYFGADSIAYWTVRMCDIPEYEHAEAKTRIEDMDTDPVQEYRRKAAEAAARAAEEAAKNDPNLRAKAQAEEIRRQKEEEARRKAGSASDIDVPTVPKEDPKRDSVSQKDSLGQKDSLIVEQKDTTKIGFLLARGHVKAYRKDMQLLCDSLRYCDLDSIGRFYKDPYIWNEGNRQYTADSVAVLIRGGRVDRAALSSNAYIITQEDSLRFDQIKSTEVMAFFDTTAALKRFDALGGATALFYLKENDQFATVNKVESKMISATLKKGELDRIHYYDSPKNDAYPVVQLPESEQRMKGFNWSPDIKPKGPKDITSLEVKPGQRSIYLRRPQAEFKQTEVFFPGYMAEIHKGLAEAKRRREEARIAEANKKDTLSAPSVADTSSAAVTPPADSSSVNSTTPSSSESSEISTSTDTPRNDSTAVVPVLSPSQQKAMEKARLAREREEARLKKIASRDSVWAEKDRRDSLKREARKLKELQRNRRITRKALIRQRKQEAKDKAKLEKYIEMYERRKAKEPIKIPDERIIRDESGA